jgi:enoyl-CoA hydratase
VTAASASYALEGTTAVITMDDGKANALSHAMIDALLAALDRAEAEAHAIVLAGRADRFSAGFDLKAMMAGPAEATKLVSHGAELLLRLFGCPRPVVIACTGHAVAAGALIVLTGDHRIGAAGAFKLGLNEVQIGLPVPVLAMELARDRLAARELPAATLMAKIYDPDGALHAGYVDAVVPAADVLARAKTEAARLSALPRTAFAATKTRLRGTTIAHIRATLADDLRTLMQPAQPTPS